MSDSVPVSDALSVSAGASATGRATAPSMLAVALLIATSGLVYELLAGTVASWVLGDSVTQFSTIVGAYLSALGLGAYLSRFLSRSLAERFVQVEIAVALVGGLMPAVLFLTFAHATHFRVALYGTVVLTGTLVGLEIPLLLRLLADELRFPTLVAKVLAYDHLGSLVGSVLYALVFAPRFGPLRTGLLFGMLNALIALWTTHLLRARLVHPGRLRAVAVLALLVLAATLFRARVLIDAVEAGPHASLAGTVTPESRA